MGRSKTSSNNLNFFHQVYKVVSRIPEGKVMTYGQIAYLIQSSKFKVQNNNLKLKMTPRLVGIALHNNPDPKNIPCHRVVNKDGKIAESYAFGGWKEQKRKLISEGVKFKDKMRVDLKFSLWQI